MGDDMKDLEKQENEEKDNKNKKKETPEERKKRRKKELIEDILTIAIMFAVFFVLKQYVLINAVIPSSSMEETIQIGDRVFGNRLAYQKEDPQRGDIVIFKYPDDESQLFIKRVIGLPGDKIVIRDGLVYINDSDEPLDEPYLAEEPTGDFGPYYVPEDSYFMLGDNRNYSKDSRLWVNTYVHEEKILAKAVFRYYPFDQIGTID